MSDDEFSALATLYLEPQYQAMAESPHATLDLLPLLKAVEAAERNRCANVAESWSDYYNSVTSIGPRIARAIRGPNVY